MGASRSRAMGQSTRRRVSSVARTAHPARCSSTQGPTASWDFSEPLGNPQVEYVIEVDDSNENYISSIDVMSGATSAPLPVPAGGWTPGEEYTVYVCGASQPLANSPEIWSANGVGTFTYASGRPPASIAVSANTTTSPSFVETDTNGDGLNDARDDANATGRGSVGLSWPAVPGADKFNIYMLDGANYRLVDAVASSMTTWTSAGAHLYPSDSRIASLAVGQTGSAYLSNRRRCRRRTREPA